MLPEAFALPAGRRLGSVYLGVFTSSNMACAALSQASTSNTGIRILFACICAILEFQFRAVEPVARKRRQDNGFAFEFLVRQVIGKF